MIKIVTKIVPNRDLNTIVISQVCSVAQRYICLTVVQCYSYPKEHAVYLSECYPFTLYIINSSHLSCYKIISLLCSSSAPHNNSPINLPLRDGAIMLTDVY